MDKHNAKNSGAGGKGYGAKTMKPKDTGGGAINKSSEMRSDGAKQVSNKHPFPEGLS